MGIVASGRGPALANTCTGAEWQTDTNDVRWDEMHRAAFTHDGEHLVVPNGRALTLIETRTGCALRTFQAVCNIYGKIESAFGFTGGGEFFVCTTRGNEKESFATCVWELRSGRESKLVGTATPLVTEDGKTLIVVQAKPTHGR